MRLSRLLGACLLTVLPSSFGAAALEQAVAARPRFVGEPIVSTNEGHATLQWETAAGDPGATVEIEQSRDREFGNQRLRYQGPGRALFVSGLREGRTYFRIRQAASGAPAGPWSEPLVVEVDYPGRGRVLLLLLVGCTVFAATVAAIVTGRLRYRQPRAAGSRAAG